MKKKYNFVPEKQKRTGDFITVFPNRMYLSRSFLKRAGIGRDTSIQTLIDRENNAILVKKEKNGKTMFRTPLLGQFAFNPKAHGITTGTYLLVDEENGMYVFELQSDGYQQGNAIDR